MIDRTILGRYTKAFMGCVIDKNLIDKVEEQLCEVDGLLKKEPDLLRVLRNPLVEKKRKKAIISGVLNDEADPLVKNFLSLLVDKKREEVFPYLYEEFARLADEEKNVIKAEVKSKYPLSSQQHGKLTGRLSEITGKKVILTQILAPEIIGGLIIQLGSKIIDASVRNRLRKIEECMLKAG